MLAPVETTASTMSFSINVARASLSPALHSEPARVRITAQSVSASMRSTMSEASARLRAWKAMSR